MIQIKKNFLSSKEHKNLFKAISGNMFPYYALPYQTKNIKTKNKQEHLLQHILMTGEKINSDWFRKIVIPFALKLPIEKMIYARLNLTVNQNKPYACAWHTDLKMTPEEKAKATTAVYYFNTCNGATEIKGHKKIKSLKNQMILFPSRLSHRAIQQTDTVFRWVLNFGYMSK
tara:strand:+ start:439 stop:954 length:516 start_codon:yes stop_codon:yes gene_type:complete